MKRKLNIGILIIVSVLIFAAILYVSLQIFDNNIKELSVKHPFDGAVFPCDISSPAFFWEDHTNATHWDIRFEFYDDEKLQVGTISTKWTPETELWETIKARTLEKTAKVTISGYRKILVVRKLVSQGSFSMSTSNDPVKAPIFFRSVTLPFEFAADNMETIKWCLGDISSEKPPKVVLENLPVCGNCHSFTADGRTLGMDVDYANDKGSYIIAGLGEKIVLSNEKVITWSDYKREDNELTFGLLSRISPDGRYAVSTVQDRSVFVPKDDPYYSQLFFPLKGILAYYDIMTRSFHALSGADDKGFVQSNQAWSPDGKYIVFARSKVGALKEDVGDRVILDRDQCEEYVTREKLFKYDLYRIPFNSGKGGTAKPIEGASNNGMSNYFAKYSPDGKWIVFCKAASFMLLQPDSRLYIMPAEGGTSREMNCNTTQMNSWHSWSPNGRWLVFSSKVFSPYTQLFLTHIDEDGNDSPPVLLSHFTIQERAANIPEFVNMQPEGIKRIRQDFIDYYSYARRGIKLAAKKKYRTKAEQLLRKSIELNPDYASSRSMLGSLLRVMERDREAESEYLVAAKIAPNNPENHNNLGSIYLGRQEYTKAQKAFEEAIALDPGFAQAYEGLGVIQFSRGDLDGAQNRFEKSIELDANYLMAYKGLGLVMLMKGQLDRAQIQLETFLKFTEDATVYYNLGIVYLNQEKYDKAQWAFENAKKLDENYAYPYEGLGLVYLMMGDNENAQQMFEAVLHLDPNLAEAR